jgi:hypothetical protein
LRLLIFPAVTLIFSADRAAAGSILERVLDSLAASTNNSLVTGIFSNTAESLSTPDRVVTSIVPNERILNVPDGLAVGDVILVNLDFGGGYQEFLAVVGTGGSLSFADNSVGTAGSSFAGAGTATIGAPLFEGPAGVLTVSRDTLLGPFQNVSGFAGFTLSTTETVTSLPNLSVGDVILINLDFGGGPQEFLAVAGTGGSLSFADNSVGTAGSSFAGAGTATIGAQLFEGPTGVLTVSQDTLLGPFQNVSGFADFVKLEETRETSVTIPGTFITIDGSVTNLVTGSIPGGLDGATALTQAGVGAGEAVTAIIGNISTTALGAVNTGEMALSGSSVAMTDEIHRAVTDVNLATQQRIDQAITQVGTSADQTVISINSALNTSTVTAAVLNGMTGVETTIGRSGYELAVTDTDLVAPAVTEADKIAAMTGGIGTTALGAVNTGTMTSGALDRVNRVITGIVGNVTLN